MTASASTNPTTTIFPCPRCGVTLQYGALACPSCGALVYADQLNQLAAQAMREEPSHPIKAATIWRQCLPLLPPDSQQAQLVQQRIAALSSGQSPGVVDDARPGAKTQPHNDTLSVALLKTIGSMIVSIIVYTWLFSGNGLTYGLEFATGFVLLMLVHEMGHVLAMKYYRLSASPPIFIPFLGALINLREAPRNALEEAIVGIGGPVTGTLAAVVTYLIYLQTHSPLILELAEFGFLLNLFNMLPVPPLDGGRVTAAVSPWIWIWGLLVAVALLIWDFMRFHQVNYILVLLLIYAFPRIKQTLLHRAHRGAYYQIGRRAMWSMGVCYLALGLFLTAMWLVTNAEISRITHGLLLN